MWQKAALLFYRNETFLLRFHHRHDPCVVRNRQPSFQNRRPSAQHQPRRVLRLQPRRSTSGARHRQGAGRTLHEGASLRPPHDAHARLSQLHRATHLRTARQDSRCERRRIPPERAYCGGYEGQQTHEFLPPADSQRLAAGGSEVCPSVHPRPPGVTRQRLARAPLLHSHAFARLRRGPLSHSNDA